MRRGSVARIEGSSSRAQRVSPELPKNFVDRLFPGERTAVRNRLIELSIKMPVDHADTMPADENSRRKHSGRPRHRRHAKRPCHIDGDIASILEKMAAWGKGTGAKRRRTCRDISHYPAHPKSLRYLFARF
jgi:hypothetical protein